jgi:uroporphyrinogen-III decarboxylase
VGTSEQIHDYTRKLIETAGKDGGFIMAAGAVIDEAKTENMKAMIDATKKYGVYPQCS